ncbi:NEAT domain-containing protein [Clostridium culturomicium]|uniref:NEAT domain-containing protein n=1 Tax=Clostridium culturomicium TaxID=1499683 RepID=UPI00058AE9B5|nr:NEAT domain-containing protein [Clostridium culturomicium]
MISKKIKQTIACALLLGVITGVAPTKVFADVLEGNEVQVVSTATTSSYKNGIYEATNETKYATEGNTTGESMARSAVGVTTKIQIKDGMYINTLSLNKDLFQFMSRIKISVDGKEIESTINEAEKTITYTLDSLSTEVKVDMFITMMGREVSFFVNNKIDTLNLINGAPVIKGGNSVVKVGDKVDLLTLVSVLDNEGEAVDLKVISDTTSFIKDGMVSKAGTYEVTFEAVDASGLSTSKTLTLVVEENKNEVLQEGSYKIKNQTQYIGSGNSDIGNDMARKTLEETSYLQVKEGKNLLTLKFNKEQFAFIGKVDVVVDGIATAINLDRNAAEAVLEIPSLNSDIQVTVEVTLMGRTSTFKTILLQDTLEKVNGEIDGDSGSGSGSGTGEGAGSGSGTGAEVGAGTSTGAGEENKEEIQIVKGKLYSIENEVHYADNNPTGLAMARQYLDSISTIEEINGVRYINLTFKGIEYMSNHRFYVNGNEVSFRKISDDGKQATFRFAIPDLGSTMKVKMYVAPMGRDVEFDITLKQDTLTFIKEYDVEVLPQTGSLIDSNMMFMLGSALAASSVLVKKRKNKSV